MTLHLGVDTGGTYTDAAVIDAEHHTVLSTAKALTTKGNLTIGVSEAITSALAALPQTFGAADVGLLSLSTTLATNAVVEGHGDRVGVVLIGFDDDMVRRTGIAEAFTDMPVLRIAGGHDHSGAERSPLDTESLAGGVGAVAHHVVAFAISSTFAVRNPAHEIRARQIITELCGKPATISTEISSSLDAPRRALTAVLNARLIGRVTHLIDAVQRSMHDLAISCPLMLVKGDGSLALAESVRLRPIETVLSGPAASVVGAQWLSGLDDFIVSDMGGTTTDLGVVVNGRPRLNELGSEVGGWRTMVRAIDIRTLGLGGDSEVTGYDTVLTIGAHRCVPLSLLAMRHPETVTMLEADLHDSRSGGALHGRFAVAPFGTTGAAQDPAAASATGRRDSEEVDMLQTIRRGPQPVREIAPTPRDRRTLERLRRSGLAAIAAFTPSDAAHVLNLQANWDRRAAWLGAQLGARLRDMKPPTAERTERFAGDVWELTVRRSARAVLDTALGQPTAAKAPLLDAVCAGEPTIGLATISVAPNMPLVAVGGPVQVYYPEVGRRLGCEVVFAEHRAVANAVGAATGVIARSITIQVEADPNGGYTVHAPNGVTRQGNGGDAIAFAEQLAQTLALDAVHAMGALSAEVRSAVTATRIPGQEGDHGLVSATITAEAIGRP